MLKWFRKLTGQPQDGDAHQTPSNAQRTRVVDSARLNAGTRPERRERVDTSRYFEAMNRLLKAVTDRDFERARVATREALVLVPGLVDDETAESRDFVLSVPPLQVGGTVLALLNDEQGLDLLRATVHSRPQLARWASDVEGHFDDLRLFREIEVTVGQNPGILQNRLKSVTEVADGRRLSRLVGWLEKAGRLRRAKKDKSYALYLPDAAEVPEPHVPLPVESHRKGRTRSADLLSWADIEHIALPLSPTKWQPSQLDEISKNVADGAKISIADGSAWEAGTLEPIPHEERPDPAFRKHYITDGGVLALDDLGKSDHLGRVTALWYRRDGTIAQRQPLDFDVYRIGLSPGSASFAALSRELVLHAYDGSGSRFLETSIRESPEVRRISQRLTLDQRSLHRAVRSVALAADHSRYMFSVVDEAWCITADGVVLWGVAVPLRDGFTLNEPEPSMVGTSASLQVALGVLGLALPVSSEDLKQRYRTLAKQWHPDVNRSPEANEKMREVNDAMSVLTGTALDALADYSGVGGRMATYDAGTSDLGGGVRVTMAVSETSAADWIYASSFAISGGRAFIATYSGRLLELDQGGMPIRYYTIGATPHRIVDSGDLLYVLTNTRLYILRADALVNVVDVGDGGDLLVAQSGFGLLESKRFRWFTASGDPVATVSATSPIRRVYRSQDDVVVETRTHRLRALGAEPWWSDS